MRCYKPITQTQLKKYESEIQWRCFKYVLGLTAMSLDSAGATKVQIQSIINGILNQYDCLMAGNVTMDDICNYLEEYGINMDGDTLQAEMTEFDNQIDLIRMNE